MYENKLGEIITEIQDPISWKINLEKLLKSKMHPLYLFRISYQRGRELEKLKKIHFKFIFLEIRTLEFLHCTAKQGKVQVL